MPIGGGILLTAGCIGLIPAFCGIRWASRACCLACSSSTSCINLGDRTTDNFLNNALAVNSSVFLHMPGFGDSGCVCSCFPPTCVPVSPANVGPLVLGRATYSCLESASLRVVGVFPVLLTVLKLFNLFGRTRERMAAADSFSLSLSDTRMGRSFWLGYSFAQRLARSGRVAQRYRRCFSDLNGIPGALRAG